MRFTTALVCLGLAILAEGGSRDSGSTVDEGYSATYSEASDWSYSDDSSSYSGSYTDYSSSYTSYNSYNNYDYDYRSYHNYSSNNNRK